MAESVQDLPAVFGYLFSFENWLGETAPLIVVTLIVAAILARRSASDASLLLLLTLVPRSAAVLIKVAVEEPRPSATLIRVDYPHDNLSFPSGHVIGFTLVFALVAIFASRMLNVRAASLAIQTLCLGLILTIGMARIWVGAHWPSDVIGGYLYALLFLLPAIAWSRGLRPGQATTSAVRKTDSS